MKPITAIIVFFSLMFPALFLGYNNYAEAKENIIKAEFNLQMQQNSD